VTTPMPIPGHSACGHLSGHPAGGHNAEATPTAKPTAVATTRVATGWTLAGAAGAWFAVSVLTISKPVCLAGVALIVLSAASYMAGWVARGRTDGR
jgi:hypothetical protein